MTAYFVDLAFGITEARVGEWLAGDLRAREWSDLCEDPEWHAVVKMKFPTRRRAKEWMRESIDRALEMDGATFNGHLV